MKKIIALVLTALLALSLVACGSETKTDDADKTEDKTEDKNGGVNPMEQFIPIRGVQDPKIMDISLNKIRITYVYIICMN